MKKGFVIIILINCLIIGKVNATSKVNNVVGCLVKIKDSIVEIAKNSYAWYEENKDELKEISKEILEEDKTTIKNAFDNTKNWYEENQKYFFQPHPREQMDQFQDFREFL